MAPEEICKRLTETFGDAIEDTVLEAGRPYAQVSAARWLEIARHLRDHDAFGFNLLRSITALDLLAENKLASIYDLSHIPLDQGSDLVTTTREFAIRVVTDRDAPSIPSVASIWPAADWHERECFDLMGIHYDGHPDLRRILCCDDWEGHPLRKDYEFPLEYNGIPATTEYEFTNPRH
ncbi:MAG: NADH-quinone oxidoreductase subunit C [Phycisphaerae bacterium]